MKRVSRKGKLVQKATKYLHLTRQSPPLQIADSSFRHVRLHTYCQKRDGSSFTKCQFSHLTNIRTIYFTSQTQHEFKIHRIYHTLTQPNKFEPLKKWILT